MQPLTRLEVQPLLTVAESQYPALYPVLLCAVLTGLRQGNSSDFNGGMWLAEASSSMSVASWF